MKRTFSTVPLAIFTLWLGACTGSTGDNEQTVAETNRVAFVTNQIADFWTIAKAGCLDAQKDFDVEVEVHMPPEATAVEQKRIIEDLLTNGIDGLALSPVDAENQIDMVNGWAAQVPLITQDSDAPGSNRLMYIGMDNYAAGRMCGELVKMAIPDGGKVMLFIGRMEQNNSKDRRQGVIDVLMDRSADNRGSFDPVDEVIQGEKYTILGTLTDQGKPERAKEKAEDAINTYSEMNAMVGLFEYNPPACYQALKQAGKLDEIKLIGFDENYVTLQAIKDGECIGTVVQDPYNYGYESVRILASLMEGDNSVIPEGKFIDIPARIIVTQSTLDTLTDHQREHAVEVDEYWADLRAKKGE